MRASVESARRRVTATVSAPWPLMVPANTSSPSVFSTGSDSPVIGAWLTSERPFLTMPSSAIFSPGLTIIKAPGSTCSMSRCRSPRSSRTRTSVEARSRSFPIAFLARSRLCASSHCAAANSETTIAASSNWRIAIAPMTATTISTLMSSERRLIDCQARSAGKIDPTMVAAMKIGALHAGNDVNQPIPHAAATRAAATAVNQPRTRAPVGAGSSAQCAQPT